MGCLCMGFRGARVGMGISL